MSPIWMNQENLKAEITEILNKKFNPTYLNIIDQSKYHKEHPAMVGNVNSETHLFIEIHSKTFDGLTTIQRHKMIMESLNFAFEKGLHALRLKLKSVEAE